MILQKINFTPLYKKIKKIFSNNLPIRKFDKIRKNFLKEVRKLANANFRCYQANMIVLAERKKRKINTQLISDMELQARTSGERRVKAKIAINVLLNKVYPPMNEKKIMPGKAWMSDDIVYSVGEMIDRLIIEFIKIQDYNSRLKSSKDRHNTVKELKRKVVLAEEWSKRVEKFLVKKLKEIDRKGYYECLEETRTYDTYLKNNK